MNLDINYDTSEAVPTVALNAQLGLKDVTLAADRLRSWARTRDVPLAGPPFLAIDGPMSCRVHLPVASAVTPHPETGIESETVPAGDYARVPDLRFGDVRTVTRELSSVLGVTEPGARAEFHSVDGDFFQGDLKLLLPTAPRARPRQLAVMTAAGAADDTAVTASRTVRVVTLARQHGTGGEAIARLVANQLGLRLVDYGVFRRAAEEAGVSPETIEDAARHRGLFSRILDVLSQTGTGSMDGWLAPIPLRSTPLFTSQQYRAFIEDAIRDLAEQGDVLILGHGAQLVLANRADTFRVLITGGEESRIARAVAQGVAEDEARDVIRTADHERIDYFRQFYASGWLDGAAYDLVINTDRVTLEEAVDIIADAASRRTAPTGDLSRHEVPAAKR